MPESEAAVHVGNGPPPARTLIAAAAAIATATSSMSGVARAAPGIGDTIIGTSLWEAAYDSTAEGDEDESESATAGGAAAEAASNDSNNANRGTLHCVTVPRDSKLGIRVRDDGCVSHFDPLPKGERGAIEMSGAVAIGDFLVKVGDAEVGGKDVREVLALIRGAANPSVILTFRRLQPSEVANVGGSYTLHLTEQHRALILRHLLSHGQRIPEDRLRFLAARGIPDCDKSLRPLIWRVLLQYLSYDREGWEAHLRGQRQIYAQFVGDLCVLPEEEKDTEQMAMMKEEEEAAAPATATTTPAAAAAAAAAAEKPKRKLLVPSSSPPPSYSSASSFDLDTSASFKALNRVPVPVSRMQNEGGNWGRGISTSSSGNDSSTSSGSGSSGGDSLEASMLGASAAGSQSHFAYARPKTRVRYQGDRALFDEIKKDVVRTYPDQTFYLDMEHGSQRYDALLRGLFIYAKVNPGIRYVQGMNEIIGTIYYVLANDPDPNSAAHAEADAFFCFTNILAQLRDIFQQSLDQADSGVEGTILELVELLARHDPELHAHFEGLGLNAHFFLLRWITTLFSRELLLADTIRVWDSMLADASLHDFVLFMCLAMIEEQRDALLANGFSFCLKLLQSYPESTDVQSLLHRAEALRKHDARVRLQGRGGTSGEHPLSPSKLRGILAKVASTIEDLEVPAALDSVAAESRRAGAQLVSMTRWLVESLNVLDNSGNSGGGGGGAKELPRRQPPPAASTAALAAESEDDASDDDV